MKRNLDGSVDEYKARLVIRGFSQRQGVGYTETHAPVASLVMIRMLFALQATDIYMEQPRGFGIDSRVCKLKRSIYGPLECGMKDSQLVSGAQAPLPAPPTAAEETKLLP